MRTDMMDAAALLLEMEPRELAERVERCEPLPALLTTKKAQAHLSIPAGTWGRLLREDRALASCRRIVGTNAVRWHRESLDKWASRLPKAVAR